MRLCLLAVVSILAAAPNPLLAASNHSGSGYNRETFVSTHTRSTKPAIESSNIALLGTGLLGIAGVIRRKFDR